MKIRKRKHKYGFYIWREGHYLHIEVPCVYENKVWHTQYKFRSCKEAAAHFSRRPKRK